MSRSVEQSLLISLAIGLLVQPVLAANPEADLAMLYGDEETVSIATGSSQPLRLSPAVASVITRQDIRAMGANTLDDVLESVPGVHVSVSRRYSSLYSIRGIHTSFNPHALMLINGFPVTEVFSGGRLPRYQLPVENIQRIEVIRGPGSAVYGADAFSGVINIITKAPEDIESGQLGIGAGAFDTYQGWVQHSGDLGDWRWSVSLEALRTQGDDDRVVLADAQSALDNFVGTNASLAPGSVNTEYDMVNSQLQLTNDHWRISLFSWQLRDAGTGPGISDALDDQGYLQSDQHLLDVSYNWQIGENWQLHSQFNYLYMDQENHYYILPPGTRVPIGSDGNLGSPGDPLVDFPDGVRATPGGVDRHWSLEFSAFYNGWDQHRLRLAAGHKKQNEETEESKNFGPGILDGTETSVDGTLIDVSDQPFVYMEDQQRRINYVSIQDEWSLARDWELTAGLRYDDYSDFGSTVNPRVALVWETSYRLTSKFLYGRAFRAPSFSEQFAINNPVILGNLELDPEQIDTYELAFDYRHNFDWQTQLNVFVYRAEDLIEYIDDDGVQGGSSTAQNALDQDGQGMELQTRWQAGNDLEIRGNLAWQKAENAATGADIPYAPQRQLYVDVRWRFVPNWYVSGQANRVMDRARDPGDPRAPVDDYTTLNLNVYSVDWLSWLDLSVSLHNALDEEVFEPSVGPDANIPGDHPMPGRSWWIKAHFKL